MSGLSKKDLTEMARELDIPGRSTMSRTDLERAVRDAGRSSSAKKAS